MDAPKPLRIAVVADYDPARPSHAATDAALRLAASRRPGGIEFRWVGTDEVAPAGPDSLAGFAAIWAGPSSPYRDPEGMLAAIRFARESGRPFVAT